MVGQWPTAWFGTGGHAADGEPISTGAPTRSPLDTLSLDVAAFPQLPTARPNPGPGTPGHGQLVGIKAV